MDFAVFYEIQVASPLKHREREYEVFHQVLKQVDLAEQSGFTNFWTVEHHFQPGFAHSSYRPCGRLAALPVQPSGAHSRAGGDS